MYPDSAAAHFYPYCLSHHHFSPGILLFQVCCNKELSIITTEMHCFIIPEAITLRSRCQHGWFLLRAVRVNLPILFPRFCRPIGILRLRETSSQSLSSSSNGVFSVCKPVCKLFLFIGTLETQYTKFVHWYSP